MHGRRQVAEAEPRHGWAFAEAVERHRALVHAGQARERHEGLVKRDLLVDLVSEDDHVRVAAEHGGELLE